MESHTVMEVVPVVHRKGDNFCLFYPHSHSLRFFLHSLSHTSCLLMTLCYKDQEQVIKSDQTKSRLQSCICDVKDWMCENKLQLIPDKTEATSAKVPGLFAILLTLPQQKTKKIVICLVLSRLDYCNSSLSRPSPVHDQKTKLHTQNCAARLILSVQI